MIILMVTEHDSNTLKLELKLYATHEIYYADTTEDMRLVITAILHSPHPITLHNQGQWNSSYGTILCKDFRLNLFDWYDETAEEQFQSPKDDDDEWGCEQGVFKHDCLEIHPTEPLIVTTFVEHTNPLCDPLIFALQRRDHVFKLKAKPQKIKWTRKTKEDLFKGGKTRVPQEEYDTWGELELACEDAVKFMVKAN
jgi:hypothetical protein